MNKNSEQELRQKINIKFSNPEIFRQALIHRSYLNENPKEPQSNERLEFLGDAILEFLVSQKLFKLFPNLAEGELTALRAKIVNTESLAAVGLELGVGGALYLSRGEEESGGRENKTLLANAIEAIIGAAFLDQGIKSAQAFVEKYIIDKAKFQLAKEYLKDPKSLLQEAIQAQKLPTPVYRKITEVGPDHAKRFTVAVYVGGKVLGRGAGRSLKVAQQEAARIALDQLEVQA